jgi:hypothetical protein
MAVLTISQINGIWSNKLALTDYVYVCEDGMLYKGQSNGTLFRMLNTNYDTWLKYKKLNENDSLNTIQSSQNAPSSNQPNLEQNQALNNQEEGELSELTYDRDGNLIKKALSLNGKVIEIKTFEYDSIGGLTKLIKSDANGVEEKTFNFNNNGDLTSINII